VGLDCYPKIPFVFFVCETRKTEHPCRIGCCGIAIEFPRQGVEECFGLFLSYSFDPPYHLKFVGRRAEDVTRSRHKIRLLNGREGFRSVAVEVDIEMLDHLYVVLRSRVGFRFQGVHAEVDVGAVSLILVAQPILKLRGRDSYCRADALESVSAPSISH